MGATEQVVDRAKWKTTDFAPGREPSVRAAQRRSAAMAVLLLVIVVFALLATIIAARTPAWESADEPGHVHNIETLVGGHWYRIGPNVGNEAHQPPLYYLVFAGWQRMIDKPVHVVNPGQAAIVGSQRRGLYAHHSSSDHDFLMWLRLPNILLGIGTILLTALAIREVSSDPWTPVVAASIVAMTPRFVFLSAFVTNDNLTFFLGALLTLLALRFLAKPNALRMLLVGIVVGLLVVTKLSALPLVAVLIVLVFATRSWLDRGRMLLVGVAGALLVSSWYFVQNYQWYGDPLARRASSRYLQANGGLGTLGVPYYVSDPIRLIVQHVPARIFSGFWYRSGWNREFQWSWPGSVPFWLVLAACLLGLVASRVSARTLVTLGVITVAAFASVWIVAFQTATYEARLAFTGLPALAGLAALGTRRWRLPVRFLLPVLGFVGVTLAIHHDVLAVRWWR